MPLAPKFTLSVLPTDAAVFVLNDTTGIYDALTNPGGYGTPNPAKATLHWLHKVTIKNKAGNEFSQLPVLLDATVIVGAESQVAVTKGGLYTVDSYAVRLFDPLAITYIVGQVLWDALLSRYVKVASLAPSGIATVVTVELADIVLADWAFVSQSIVFYAFDVERVLGWMLKKLPATDNCDLEKWLLDFERVRTDAEAIRLLSCRKHYNNALLLLARYQNNFYRDIC